MKKFIALLISLVCLFALSVCVFANEKPGDKLEVKLYCEVDGRYYFADVAENKSDDVRVGETLNLVFNDFSDLKSMNANGKMKFGIMLVDDENGEGEVTYHISDVTLKSNGQTGNTISAEGTYTEKLKKGIYEDDTAIIHELNMSGDSSNMTSISEVSLSVNYISYSDASASNSNVNTAESIPEEEETIPENPATGITYSVLPLCAAAIAIVISISRR